ncbi:MAG TPA: hypothetical protein VFJ85_09065 [Acidimicrobiales bacterium]|nr:hypothetical protein [Acidimicrobiales bacterium]
MGVLAGTRSGLTDVVAGGVVGFAGRDVTALSGPWAVLDGHVVARRDGPEVKGDASLTCVAGEPGGTALAGAAGGHLFRAGGHDLATLPSFEDAPGRSEWYTPWGGPPDTRSVAVAGDGTALVNVHVGGILRSTDGGRTWSPTIDLHADVHQVLALDGGRALAACAVGLAASADGGATWEVEADGLHATYARSVALAGATVLVGVSTGPGGSLAALYRRPFAGGTLARCAGGLPDDLGGNVDTFRLAGGPDGTAAVALADGDVWLSRDEGVTWERLANVPGVRCLTLV